MKLPTPKNFDVLRERKNHLVEIKKQSSPEQRTPVNAEIQAINRLLGFTSLIYNQFPNEQVKEILEEYKKNRDKEKVKLPQENKVYTVLQAYEMKIDTFDKLIISYIQKDKMTFVQIEALKYKYTKFRWESRGKIQLTLANLENISGAFKEFLASQQPPLPAAGHSA